MTVPIMSSTVWPGPFRSYKWSRIRGHVDCGVELGKYNRIEEIINRLSTHII